MTKRWTLQEIEFLKDNMGKISISKVANKLNRSQSSIRCRIIRLGFSSKHEKWTSERRDQFIRMYPTESKERILKEFPFLTWSSAMLTASKFRKKGFSVPYRRIRRVLIEDAPHLKLTEVEKVDLARMIDTDGHIGVSSGKMIRIGFSNINKDLLDHFVRLASINNKTVVRKRGSNRNPSGGVWTSKQLNVYAILRETKDYFIAKRKRAALALRYIELLSERLSKQTYNQGPLKMSEEEKRLITQIRKFNQEGENKLGIREDI